MDARDYEQDVLCDLPTADLNNWALRRYPSTGDSLSTGEDSRMQSTSDGTRLSVCDDSDVCDYQGFAYIEDSDDHSLTGHKPGREGVLGGIDDHDDLDSCTIPRVATPIPASTMRHTYLEAVREMIDAESGGESIPPTPSQHQTSKQGRLSALRWASYRKIRTPRPSFSKRHPHKRPRAKVRWRFIRSVARAFCRSPSSRS